MDQELADVATYAPSRCYVQHSPDGSTLLREITSWPPSWKYNFWTKIGTPPIDVYLLEEQSCQISSWSDL